MKVELLDYMGSDLSVVDAARVSFNKESQWEDIDNSRYLKERYPNKPQTFITVDDDGFEYLGVLSDKDTKLIAYLAKNGHWSPFAHCFASFRIKAPIFVARQLVKHQVGLSWNEVSRRYVDSPPEFYTPEIWRKRVENVKQGSSNEAALHQRDLAGVYSDVLFQATDLYDRMLAYGVAPEQARMVLPQSMMTEWIWSGSLYAFARVCTLRLDAHAQAETREVAVGISDALAPLFPVSWSVLVQRS